MIFVDSFILCLLNNPWPFGKKCGSGGVYSQCSVRAVWLPPESVFVVGEQSDKCIC